MGQNSSDVNVSLATLDDVDVGEDESKLRRMLKKLTDNSDGTNIVSRWEQDVLRKRTKSFIVRWTLGSFAVKTLENWGKINLMLAFSVYLVELAQEDNADVPGSRSSSSGVFDEKLLLADSYLNLARANLNLSRFAKVLDYSKKSLEKINEIRETDSRAVKLSGYYYLYKGKGDLGLSDIKEAIKNFEKSFDLAQSQAEKRLECLVCCSMVALYLQLKDIEKAIFFSVKASTVLQEHGKEWKSDVLIQVQLSLAEAYRKSGNLEDAMSTAEDAMQIAISDQNRLYQGYGMLCFADIHRARSDADQAVPRYDAALGIMTEVGDQYGRALVSLGRAKAYFLAQNVSKSLADYEFSLKIAESIQNKMLCLRVYGEMALFYQRMSNNELAKSCTEKYHGLLFKMGLLCGVCDKPMGEKQEQLEVLSCFHLFHLRCVSDKGLQNLGQLACPSCRK